MDPLTVILGALSVAGAKVADRPGDQRWLRGLKALIVRKFGAAQPKLQEHLEAYTEDPDTWEKPAAKNLRDAGVDRDQEVLDAATELLKAAEAVQPGATGGLVGQINAANGRIVVANRIEGGVRF